MTVDDEHFINILSLTSTSLIEFVTWIYGSGLELYQISSIWGGGANSKYVPLSHIVFSFSYIWMLSSPKYPGVYKVT